MEWVERLNEAADYLEEHLTGQIDPAQLGRIACCSSYHFQRMFAYLAGVPLSEYIRRRRMSRAAVDLQNGEKIIDVALKYGYQSPTAFNRAFRSVHGVAPSAVKDKGVPVRSFPPISFQITIKGAQEMEYRIEEKGAFRIVGISVPLEKEIEKNFAVIPEKWRQIAADGTLARLAGMMNTPPMGVLGVSTCGDDAPWRYYIAVSTDRPAEELEEYTVPAATWAVFCGEGTSASIQELERRVVTEWLPTSGYEYGGAPDIEVYLNADPQNARYEVWIPVVRRREETAP